jgi:predicted permease
MPTDPCLEHDAASAFLIWTITLQVLIGFTLAYLINKKFRATICGRRSLSLMRNRRCCR